MALVLPPPLSLPASGVSIRQPRSRNHGVAPRLRTRAVPPTMDKAKLCAHMVRHFKARSADGHGRPLRRDDAAEFLNELQRLCVRELRAGEAVSLSGIAMLVVQPQRREQRVSVAELEARASEAGGRNSPDRSRESLPTRHQQVEQGRAPTLLPYHGELAWHTADDLRDHRRPHR